MLSTCGRRLLGLHRASRALASASNIVQTPSPPCITDRSRLQPAEVVQVRGFRGQARNPPPPSNSTRESSSWKVLERERQAEDAAAAVEDGRTQEDLEIVSKVDEQISSGSYGRLFAVVYINERQFKVTAGDVLMLDGLDLGAPVGERIAFDKVIMVGGRDFTLVGRPVLPRDLARVTATVVEKNLSKTNVHHVKWKKLCEARTYFSRSKQTSLRINAVDLQCPIEEAKDRIGFETRDGDPAFL